MNKVPVLRELTFQWRGMEYHVLTSVREKKEKVGKGKVYWFYTVFNSDQLELQFSKLGSLCGSRLWFVTRATCMRFGRSEKADMVPWRLVLGLYRHWCCYTHLVDVGQLLVHSSCDSASRVLGLEPQLLWQATLAAEVGRQWKAVADPTLSFWVSICPHSPFLQVQLFFQLSALLTHSDVRPNSSCQVHLTDLFPRSHHCVRSAPCNFHNPKWFEMLPLPQTWPDWSEGAIWKWGAAISYRGQRGLHW